MQSPYVAVYSSSTHPLDIALNLVKTPNKKNVHIFAKTGLGKFVLKAFLG
jgi:hypothetical protein